MKKEMLGTSTSKTSKTDLSLLILVHVWNIALVVFSIYMYKHIVMSALAIEDTALMFASWPFFFIAYTGVEKEIELFCK